MPRFAFMDRVNIARPFVGKGPKVYTCIPAEAKPETSAGSSV